MSSISVATSVETKNKVHGGEQTERDENELYLNVASRERINRPRESPIDQIKKHGSNPTDIDLLVL